MRTRYALEADDVQHALAAAKAEARQHGWPVTIAVVDDGGHPLGLVRMDGAAPSSAYTALEKARTAALGRRESRLFEESINGGRLALLSAPLTGMLEGGVPILIEDVCVGAIGVSGVRSSEDAQIARAGVLNVKL
ncbi:GlcG/HbpS family heme-binding protein [Burkholderia gladioli]|uniref:GlcG/HbpS family heme-binding protein n=1 Tax=Burkholderia gladioli TaxID=28095 RepID=UPI0016408E69|nr:heme-binding protein [Burkholderia gladioli]